MKYCLDTNTVIYYLKGKYPTIERRLRELSPRNIFIPEMVVAELRFGALKSRQSKRNWQRIEAFMSPLTKLPFADEATNHYADIRKSLETQGQPIGPNDLIIASTARAYGTILITRNTREFGKVSGLQIEDWTESKN